MIAVMEARARYVEHEQSRYPLATLLLLARERGGVQRARLLALVAREARARGVDL